MLDLAFEVLGQAASNSLLMFCFCNLIIVIILKGSKPELSSVAEELNFTPSPAYAMDKNAKEEMDFAPPFQDNDQKLIDVVEAEDECEDTNVDDDENGDNYGEDHDQEDDKKQRGEEEEEEDEEEEDDDELRKRVEAFIAKVNREWKNEKLRALNLQT